MLCCTCVGMLRDGKGKVSSESHVQAFDHHKTFADLRYSVQKACLICMDIAKAVGADCDVADDGPLFVRAYLKRVKEELGRGDQFILELDMYENGSCAFILNEAGE